MKRYLLPLVIVGLLFAIGFAAIDKLIYKVKDLKKRKYLKIALYVVLYFCMGIICTEIVAYYK